MPDKSQIKRKIPMRMCIACREMKPKPEMLRVVKSPEGQFILDFKGKASGRGAYICGNIKCIEMAGKKRLFNRVFSCEVPQEIYAVIGEQLLAKK